RPALVPLPAARSPLCRRPLPPRMARPRPACLHAEFLMLLAAAALGLAAPPADAAPAEPAGPAAQPHSHIHAPGEIEEAHGPLLLQIAYTGEVMANVAGGRRRGARYVDNLDLVFEADLERIAGWTGAQLHVYGLYNNGRSISNL